MLRVARPSVGWRHINALLLRQYRGIVPNEIEPRLIPIPGCGMIAEKRVLDRRYRLVVPRNQDHAIQSHSSGDKLLLLAL